MALAVDVVILIVVTHLIFDDNRWWLLALTVAIRVVLPSVTGRTPGGWLLRHQLRRADGHRANPFRIALRELLGVTGLITYTSLAPTPWWFAVDVTVLAFFVLGAFVIPVLRRDQRSLPDLAAGTRAVPTAVQSRTDPLSPVPQ
jgi:hypothetical protein